MQNSINFIVHRYFWTRDSFVEEKNRKGCRTLNFRTTLKIRSNVFSIKANLLKVNENPLKSAVTFRSQAFYIFLCRSVKLRTRDDYCNASQPDGRPMVVYTVHSMGAFSSGRFAESQLLVAVCHVTFQMFSLAIINPLSQCVKYSMIPRHKIARSTNSLRTFTLHGG